MSMERYEYVETISSGAYGVCYKVLDTGTGQQCAAKGIKQAHEDAEVMRLTLREVKVLKTLPQHVNIVKLLEAFRSQSGRVYLVFEFVERSLHQELDRHPSGSLPGPMVKSVAWQLLHALGHCHDNGVMHRDVKPANVLLTGYNPGVGSGGVVKLCDFGFARSVVARGGGVRVDRGGGAGSGGRGIWRAPGGGAIGSLSSYIMTRWYRPPEVLVGDWYGTPIDVWSYGCTLAELATGCPLFPGRSTVDQLWRIMRCLGPLTPAQTSCMRRDVRLQALWAPPPRLRKLRQRLPDLDPRLFEVIAACLTLDPLRRPTVQQLLQMPYFWDVRRMIANTDLAKQLPYARDVVCTITARVAPAPAEDVKPASATATVVGSAPGRTDTLVATGLASGWHMTSAATTESLTEVRQAEPRLPADAAITPQQQQLPSNLAPGRGEDAVYDVSYMEWPNSSSYTGGTAVTAVAAKGVADSATQPEAPPPPPLPPMSSPRPVSLLSSAEAAPSQEVPGVSFISGLPVGLGAGILTAATAAAAVSTAAADDDDTATAATTVADAGGAAAFASTRILLHNDAIAGAPVFATAATARARTRSLADLAAEVFSSAGMPPGAGAGYAIAGGGAAATASSGTTKGLPSAADCGAATATYDHIVRTLPRSDTAVGAAAIPSDGSRTLPYAGASAGGPETAGYGRVLCGASALSSGGTVEGSSSLTFVLKVVGSNDGARPLSTSTSPSRPLPTSTLRPSSRSKSVRVPKVSAARLRDPTILGDNSNGSGDGGCLGEPRYDTLSQFATDTNEAVLIGELACIGSPSGAPALSQFLGHGDQLPHRRGPPLRASLLFLSSPTHTNTHTTDTRGTNIVMESPAGADAGGAAAGDVVTVLAGGELPSTCTFDYDQIDFATPPLTEAVDLRRGSALLPPSPRGHSGPHCHQHRQQPNWLLSWALQSFRVVSGGQPPPATSTFTHTKRWLGSHGTGGMTGSRSPSYTPQYGSIAAASVGTALPGGGGSRGGTTGRSGASGAEYGMVQRGGSKGARPAMSLPSWLFLPLNRAVTSRCEVGRGGDSGSVPPPLPPPPRACHSLRLTTTQRALHADNHFLRMPGEQATTTMSSACLPPVEGSQSATWISGGGGVGGVSRVSLLSIGNAGYEPNTAATASSASTEAGSPSCVRVRAAVASSGGGGGAAAAAAAAEQGVGLGHDATVVQQQPCEQLEPQLKQQQQQPPIACHATAPAQLLGLRFHRLSNRNSSESESKLGPRPGSMTAAAGTGSSNSKVGGCFPAASAALNGVFGSCRSWLRSGRRTGGGGAGTHCGSGSLGGSFHMIGGNGNGNGTGASGQGSGVYDSSAVVLRSSTSRLESGCPSVTSGRQVSDKLYGAVGSDDASVRRGGPSALQRYGTKPSGGSKLFAASSGTLVGSSSSGEAFAALAAAINTGGGGGGGGGDGGGGGGGGAGNDQGAWGGSAGCSSHGTGHKAVGPTIPEAEEGGVMTIAYDKYGGFEIDSQTPNRTSGCRPTVAAGSAWADGAAPCRTSSTDGCRAAARGSDSAQGDEGSFSVRKGVQCHSWMAVEPSVQPASERASSLCIRQPKVATQVSDAAGGGGGGAVGGGIWGRLRSLRLRVRALVMGS